MKKSIEDYTRMMRGRYARRTGKRARSALLDEFCESTGLERKCGIKVLAGQRRKSGQKKRGAPPTYTADDVAVLKEIWFAAGQPCGKRLAGTMLQMWMKSWQRRHRRLPRGQVKRLEAISAAQIDRRLSTYRTGPSRRRVGSGLAAMQREVTVRCQPWVETLPGAVEIDTVALCGGSMSGAIVWALDATDIHSGWTEVRAVWNRGGHATCQRMQEIEQSQPFLLRLLDFDNGSEFLNGHFIRHYQNRDPKVELSRSRPYRKNDNAHIEQKNYTHVRQLLGDDRFDAEELVEPLNEVLTQWSLWNNLYGAQRRLVKKERQADGKVKRKHEAKASTPCERLLAQESLPAESRRRLKRQLRENDPIEMKEAIESKLKSLYEHRERLRDERGGD